MPEYIKIDSVFEQMDVLRASGSMPFVSEPVLIHGKRYLDGGISDRIPFRFAESLDCDKLIVILTRDMAYRKKQMSPALIRLWFGKSPIAEKLHSVYDLGAKDGMNYVIHKILLLAESPTCKLNPLKQPVNPLMLKNGKRGFIGINMRVYRQTKTVPLIPRVSKERSLFLLERLAAVVCSICGKIHILVLE